MQTRFWIIQQVFTRYQIYRNQNPSFAPSRYFGTIPNSAAVCSNVDEWQRTLQNTIFAEAHAQPDHT
jgi:hypothetical protein